MLSKLKDNLAAFKAERQGKFSVRDEQGLAKIEFELDLLAKGHEKKKVKKSTSFLHSGD